MSLVAGGTRHAARGTNPIERLNMEVKRRAYVVGILPNEASITRLIGAILFERNDERQNPSTAPCRSELSRRSTPSAPIPFSA